MSPSQIVKRLQTFAEWCNRAAASCDPEYVEAISQHAVTVRHDDQCAAAQFELCDGAGQGCVSGLVQARVGLVQDHELRASIDRARHHRHFQAMAHLQHGLHLFLCFRQSHHQGALAISCQTVALVGRDIFGVVEQGMRGQYFGQRLDHLTLTERTRWRVYFSCCVHHGPYCGRV